MSTDIHNSIIKALKPFFDKKGIAPDSFPTSDSLITSGVIDSMAFVNLLLELETEFNVSLDFNNTDVKDLVSIDGLCNVFKQSSGAA